MTLKVGDKLLCKKSNVSSKMEVEKNYTITGFDQNGVYFDDDWYSLYPESNWYIWKYFYSSQEIRKLKLEKLKQSIDVESR